MRRHSFKFALGLAVAYIMGCAPGTLAYRTVGIIDRAGRAIVPCDYHRIECLGKRFFFAEDMDVENPLKWSFKGRVFDYTGREVKINIPSGHTLSKVIWPALANDSKEGGLPKETILEIHGQDGFGLCRLNGEVILEPKYEAIGTPNEEFFYILSGDKFSRTKLLFTLNSKTGERITSPSGVTFGDTENSALFPYHEPHDGKELWGYIARNGRVVIRAQFSSAGKFSSNGLARVSSGRNTCFYIDKKGKVKSPVYRLASDFFGDTAVVQPSNGGQDRRGLINSKFQYVLKPKYAELDHLFDQVYGAKVKATDCYEAISRNGKTIFKFPPETTSIGRAYYNLTGCVVKTETGAIKYVLVDRTGKIIVPNADKPIHFDFELAVVGRKAPNNHTEWEVVDSAGRVLQPFQETNFQIIGPDRILKSIHHNHFNAAAWKSPRPMGQEGMNRFDHFAYFLMDFDLIGMPRTKVQELLGDSERPSRVSESVNFYLIATGQCGNSWAGLEIEFENDKAYRWREVWLGAGGVLKSAPWVITNMVYDPQQEMSRKSDAQPVMTLSSK